MNLSPLNALRRSDGSEVVTQEEIAISVVVCVLVTLACALLSDLRARPQTRAWGHSFCGALVAVLVLVEYAYVVQLAMRVPSDMALELLRKDCWDSTKGGKHSGNMRGCARGEGGVCSKAEPCDPCDGPVTMMRYQFPGDPFTDDFVNGWIGIGGKKFRCGLCDTAGATANCYFQPGLGPYCRRADGVVEACRKCCTPRSGEDRWSELYRYTCEAVFEPEFFPWNATGWGCPAPRNATAAAAGAAAQGQEQEQDEKQLVLTRFGCCPPSPDRGALDLHGWSGLDEVPNPTDRQLNCYRGGPFRNFEYGHWEGCPALPFAVSNESSSEHIYPEGGTASILNHLRCPVVSNGKFLENFCVPPVEL